MGFDEKLFGRIIQQYKKLLATVRPVEENPNRVELANLTRRLELLLSLLSETRVHVLPCDDEGGLEGSILFLPSYCERFPTIEMNLLYYLHRVFIASSSVASQTVASRPRDADEAREYWLKENPDSNPPFTRLWEEHFSFPVESRDDLFFYGRNPVPERTGQGASAARDPSQEASNRSVAPPPSAKPKTAYRPEVIELKPEEQNPVIHAFEKVETAEEFAGGNRQLDGSNELEDQADALSELNLRRVIRTQETAKSVLHSDAWIESSHLKIEDSERTDRVQNIFQYPEWQERKRSYLEDWCTLYEGTVVPDEVSSVTIPLHNPALRRQLEKFRNRLDTKKGQKDGDDLDLDSLVAFSSDPVQKKTVTEPKIYVRRQFLKRDWTTLILVDGSLSTDSWVQNRRVMDVIKAGVAQTCDPLDALGAQFAVASFHSNTRKQCHFEWIKTFDQSWKRAYPRLIGLKPKGYTRIGPAVRHATEVLKNQSAHKKVLILVSDSKPSDFDPYEGQHGIFDVKKSVQEANANSIIVRAISVSGARHSSFSTMFGANGFETLSSPREFETKLVRIFERLMKG